MELYQLKLHHKNKVKRRVGRGGKRGTYSGRGNKGQMSRAGRKPRATFAGGDTTFAKRLPKQRGSVGVVGIKHGVKLARFRCTTVVVNLDKIAKCFKAGDIVSLATLKEKGLITQQTGQRARVKILGRGESLKGLQFKGVAMSKAVKTKLSLGAGKKAAAKSGKEAVYKKALSRVKSEPQAAKKTNAKTATAVPAAKKK